MSRQQRRKTRAKLTEYKQGSGFVFILVPPGLSGAIQSLSGQDLVNHSFNSFLLFGKCGGVGVNLRVGRKTSKERKDQRVS